MVPHHVGESVCLAQSKFADTFLTRISYFTGALTTSTLTAQQNRTIESHADWKNEGTGTKKRGKIEIFAAWRWKRCTASIWMFRGYSWLMLTHK
jgi:hypothetical protein